MSLSHSLPPFNEPEIYAPEGPPPRWQLMRLPESDNQEVLVLTDGVWTEVTGLTATHVHDRLQRIPTMDTVQHLRALRDGGVVATDVEMAVHARVRSGLWHGAFAAACLHLLPASDDFPQRLNAEAIRTDPAAVGVIDSDPNGPPYVAIGRNGASTECLLFTWCKDWQAFRGVFQTRLLCPGQTFFIHAFERHMRAVVRLMGQAAIASRPLGEACAN